MRRSLICIALLALVGCEPTVAAPSVRYVVMRSDRPGIESELSSIETILDRQTGKCYFVTTLGAAVSTPIETACDVPLAESR